MSSGTRGHIYSRWLHILRMDIWLQIYHPFWNSYNGNSHERLPVGAWSVMRVNPASWQPGPKAFFVEDCMEFTLSLSSLYWQIEFVFVWSTSNYHHVNPPVSAVVKCKMIDLDYYGLKVKMSIAFWRALFPRNLFQHPRCWSLLCLQWQSMVSVGYS